MANIKDYIKKVMDGTVSLEEQQKALSQIEQTIKEQKQKRDEAVGQKADMVVQALRKIEERLNNKYQELLNTPAMKGEAGPVGPKGKDGKDGVNGRDGRDGKDGQDGINGTDGSDGVSVVDAKVDFDGSLVIYLSNGNEIDAGKVISEETASQIIINSGGSGTSQSVLDTLVSLQDQIDTLTGIDGVLGTMAQQNDTAVDINGGAIDNTPIGATTPSTGSFTTLTAQTEVLKGTGQNFLTYSNTFTNGVWSQSNVTVATTTATTDPVGGLNAFIITSTVTSSAGISQTVTLSTNTYTASIYAKAGTCNFLRFVGLGAGNPTAWFNLSTGAVGTVQVGLTASITSIGNGWYRCSITGTGSAIPLFRLSDTDNSTNVTNGSYIYFYGSQLEIGSVTNTYIQTTTTAIYGTPSLSFSGVAGIGLESNGSLYHQPAGTGAVQAQATTSTATGGNVRGANAVDWQTLRGSASRVSSGSYSVIGGGYDNLSNNTSSTVAGGYSNAAQGQFNFVGGGQSNLTNDNHSSVVGGQANSALGYYNFIGGGFTNSGTANSAVTTQATTTVTSGSTAVTLSGSNASIKVGQLIAGTGIVNFTYVAAISGTSLTLSQNANATGTPTLSFYTPHGVIVGGGNNQATGSYSFIGGGGDAGTASNRNVASGDWSVVAGGFKNTTSGIGAVIGGGGTYDGANGGGNTASGVASFIAAGWGNTASSNGCVALGVANTVSGNYSTAIGYAGNTRGLIGNIVFTGNQAPIAAGGANQAALMVLGVQTTDATATVLRSNTSAAGTTNQVILPNNSAYYFRGEIVAGKTAGGDTKGWFIEGVIKRGANAASTAMVGTATVTSNYADAGASTWTVAVAADTTNGGLKITVTGQAATTIRWVAQVRTTEMTY